MKMSKILSIFVAIFVSSVKADFVENASLKRQFLSNCSIIELGEKRVKFCLPKFMMNQLRKEEKSLADILQCLNQRPSFFNEIIQKQGHFSQGNEISTVISFTKHYKQSTILLNTTPVAEPLTGGEILLIPFPSTTSEFCRLSHQKRVISKAKSILEKIEQAALKSRIKGF